MNTYVLLQSPAQHGEYSPQIIILDTKNNKLDNRKAEKLIDYGYKLVGYIDSDCKPKYLKDGFESELEYKRQLACSAAKRMRTYFEALNELVNKELPSNLEIAQELLMTSGTTGDKIESGLLNAAEGVSEDDG